jgi:protein-disulfide isomerase
LTGLGSAPVPGVGAQDHVRGPADAQVVIEYLDFECPFCAVLGQKLSAQRLRLVVRHFPVRTSHPRAWAAACAAEAANAQGRFWEMHDLLLADQGRLEDPHLWQRARTLGLDLERFERDRRSPAVRARVQRDFRSGIRAGVVSTPALLIGGRMHSGQLEPGLLDGAVS